MATIVNEQVLEAPTFTEQSATFHAGNLRRLLKLLSGGTSGIVKGFEGAYEVTANSTPDKTIKVASGQALMVGGVDPIREGSYLIESFAEQTITVPDADATYDRIDRAALLVYDGEFAGTPGTYRATAGLVLGTPAQQPQVPDLPGSADNVVAALPCGRIYVGAGVTAIPDEVITDDRTYWTGPGIVRLGKFGPSGNQFVISDIPPGFSKIHLDYRLRVTGSNAIEGVYLRPNNDSGNSYNMAYADFEGGAIYPARSNGSNAIQVGTVPNAGSHFSIGEVDIPAYADAGYKVVKASETFMYPGIGQSIQLFGGAWWAGAANSTPITSLVLFSGSAYSADSFVLVELHP